MADSDILVVNYSQSRNCEQVLPFPILLSSQRADWESINLRTYAVSHPWKTPVHISEQHLLIVNLDQEPDVVRRLGNRTKTERSRVGQVILVPKGTEHSCVWSESGSSFMVIELEPSLLVQVAYKLVSSERLELLPTFAQPDPFIYGTGLALQQALKDSDNRPYVEALAQSLAMHLLQYYAICPIELQEDRSGLSRHQLEQAVSYVQTHLDQPIKLADIAALLGMSQFHFCRLFRQSTGLPPYKYVIQQRVERAKRLLQQNQELSVADVALECGFAGQSHLTKHFRQLTGTTPKAYQKRSRWVSRGE